MTEQEKYLCGCGPEHSYYCYLEQRLKETENQLALRDSWVKHHQACVQEHLKEKHVLESRLKEAGERLKEASAVIEFYARPENWTVDHHEFEDEIVTCHKWDEFLNRIRVNDWGDDRISGKRAREYLVKYGGGKEGQ